MLSFDHSFEVTHTPEDDERADESANQVESSVKFSRRLSVKFQPNTDREFAS
jgi:hypothetical protein